VIAEQIDIRAEVAKVHGELLFFRRRVLPALFETRLDAVGLLLKICSRGYEGF
jgi:hypothetical protein